MKALWSGVSLLVVLALVGWLAARQMTAGANRPMPAPVPLGASAPRAGDDALSARPAQERVRADIDRAMQEAAEARRRGADQ